MRKSFFAFWIILLGVFSAPTLAESETLHRWDYCDGHSIHLNGVGGRKFDDRTALALYIETEFEKQVVGNWATVTCPGTSGNCTLHRNLGYYNCTVYSVSSNCAADKTWSNTSQTCENLCPTNSTIPASDPACVAPPNACEGKATEQVAYQVTSGITTDTFCDGSCEFTVQFNNDRTTCWNYDGSTTRYCDYDKVFPGTTCTTADNMSTDTNATSSGGSITAGTGAQTAVDCPTGYTLGTDNLCHAPSTAGTPSTSNTPATSGTTGATTCPVGFALLDGNCTATTSGATSGTCPTGYTLVAGVCVSSQTVSAGGGTGTSASTGEQAAVESDGTGLINSTGAPSHGWTWAPSIPSATCAPWVIAAGGKELVIDPCPTAEKIRALLAFVFYVLTAFGLFSILFRSEATS